MTDIMDTGLCRVCQSDKACGRILQQIWWEKFRHAKDFLIQKFDVAANPMNAVASQSVPFRWVEVCLQYEKSEWEAVTIAHTHPSSTISLGQKSSQGEMGRRPKQGLNPSCPCWTGSQSHELAWVKVMVRHVPLGGQLKSWFCLGQSQDPPCQIVPSKSLYIEYPQARICQVRA